MFIVFGILLGCVLWVWVIGVIMMWWGIVRFVMWVGVKRRDVVFMFGFCEEGGRKGKMCWYLVW